MKGDPGVGEEPGQQRGGTQGAQGEDASSSPAVADALRLPDYGWTVDKANLRKLADLAVT